MPSAANGYATAHPEERRIVLGKLGAFQKRMREDATISYAYINTFALEPLQDAIRRFVESAPGLAIRPCDKGVSARS
jgi:hypothetical protein